jgi:hypothetical protein
MRPCAVVVFSLCVFVCVCAHSLTHSLTHSLSSLCRGSYCGTPVAIKELYDADNAIIQKLVKREVATLK